MNENENKFSVSLFGYDKEEVETALKKLKAENQMEIDKIVKKIDKVRAEKNLLKEWHKVLKKESEAGLEPMEYIEDILKKIEEIICSINKVTAECEPQKSKIEMRDSEKFKNKKIEGLNLNIQSDRTRLFQLINEIRKVGDNLDRNMTELITLSDCNAQIRGADLSEERNKNEDELRDSAFGGSSTIPEEGKINNRAQKLDFWGDELQELIEGNIEDIKKTEEALMLDNRGKNETAAVQERSLSVQGEESVNAYKYLIGKIVGENLMDDENNIIAAKGTTISKEIIEKAKENGKLSELIVNMTIFKTVG